jgi:hypothetical protein
LLPSIVQSHSSPALNAKKLEQHLLKVSWSKRNRTPNWLLVSRDAVPPEKSNTFIISHQMDQSLTVVLLVRVVFGPGLIKSVPTTDPNRGFDRINPPFDHKLTKGHLRSLDFVQKTAGSP